MSNDGDNNLGSTPATIRALPAIVDAVGGEIEIVLDGGCPPGQRCGQGGRPGGLGIPPSMI
jgi:isopentenyl diphosphate isomerase/L-lactate dehydrogenase-like FMN-dependent dehydrogenase